jgi:hypothetical protein
VKGCFALSRRADPGLVAVKAASRSAKLVRIEVQKVLVGVANFKLKIKLLLARINF